MRSGTDLAVFFVAIVVEAEFIEEAVGFRESGDVFGGEECGEAFLPEVMQTFDFAFGLWGGREAQGDLVEMQGGTELGEGIGLMGEEEGMIIDVEREREATSHKGAGEKVEMGQECLAWVEPNREGEGGCDRR